METEGCETRQKQETRNDWENYTKQYKKGKAYRRQDFVNQEQNVQKKRKVFNRDLTFQAISFKLKLHTLIIVSY